MTVLPDLMPTSADAYLMQRGKGIEKWPRGGPITITDGFVLAFGFSFEYTLGVVGLVWAEVHASLDVLLAQRPLTLAGFGAVGGSLNLGPLSIGVDAQLSFLVAENADPYIHARLCGHIDLFFTEIEGCVEISIHNEPKPVLPPPDVHPLDDVQNGVAVGDLAFLIDDGYRRVGQLTVVTRTWGRLAGHAAPPLLRRLPQAHGGLHGRTVRRDRDAIPAASRPSPWGTTWCTTSGRSQACSSSTSPRTPTGRARSSRER